MTRTPRPVVYLGMSTPWGTADSARVIAPGIGSVGTPPGASGTPTCPPEGVGAPQGDPGDRGGLTTPSTPRALRRPGWPAGQAAPRTPQTDKRPDRLITGRAFCYAAGIAPAFS